MKSVKGMSFFSKVYLDEIKSSDDIPRVKER